MIFTFRFKIFLFNLKRFFNLLCRCLLCFLLESIKKNYQKSFIKATEDPENIAFKFNLYLKQSISSFKVLKELFWYPISNSYKE